MLFTCVIGCLAFRFPVYYLLALFYSILECVLFTYLLVIDFADKAASLGPNLQDILRSSYDKIYLRIIVRQC